MPCEAKGGFGRQEPREHQSEGGSHLMTEIFSGKRRELRWKWRRTWQATEETGKKLTRAREKL